MSYIDRIKVQGTEYDVQDRRVRLADGQDFDYGTLVQGGINNNNGYTTGAHLRRSETYWPVIEGPVNVVMQNGLTGYIRLYDSSRTMIDPGEGMPGSDTTNHVLVIAKNTTMTLTMKEYNPNTAYFRFYFSCGSEEYVSALVRENARIVPLQTVATSGDMQMLGDDVSDLKSEIAALSGVNNAFYEIGRIDPSSGSEEASLYRIRSNYIDALASTELIVGNSYQVLWVGYDSSKVYVSGKTTFYSAGESFSFEAVISSHPTIKYIRLVYKRSDNGKVSASDVATVKTFLDQETRIDKAEENITLIQDELADFPTISRAMLAQQLGRTDISNGYIATDGVSGASSNWRLHYFDINGAETINIATGMSAIGATAATKYPYVFYDSVVTSSNIGNMTASNVLSLAEGNGGADVGKASAASIYKYNDVIVPSGAKTLVICSGSPQAYIDAVECSIPLELSALQNALYNFQNITLNVGTYTIFMSSTYDTRNIIISAHSYSEGDSLPTLQAKQALYTSPAYDIGSNSQYKSNQWRVPPMINGTSTTISIVVPSGVSLHIKELSIEFSDFTKKGNGVVLCGHNGFYGMCPKDTMPSFEMANKLGYPICITIPKVTQDDVLVCIHNDTINATARDADGDAPSEDIYVSDMTYNELLKWDFGVYKNSYWKGTKIPTVDEFFNLCSHTGIEPMFSTHPDLTKSQWQNVKTMLKKHGILNKFHIKSFNDSALATAFSVFGDEIASYTLDVASGVSYQTAISSMNDVGISGNVKQVIEYDEDEITRPYVDATLNAGYSCAVWNVFNISGARYKELLEMGVTIFTDDYNCSNGLVF